MTREQLLASLTASREDIDAITYDDGSYLDWSQPLYDKGAVIGRLVELGDGTDAAQIEMPWDRIERLQRALTLLLLERDA